MGKLAPRACRECCGYHSGYTFKRQPIGAKYVAAAAETLNYVNTKMQTKSGNQKYHYMSHRILQDLQHRCIARPAPEEWNLAANWHPQDVKHAEFFRTYMSHEFPGGLLLRRLESEQALRDREDIPKVLPAIGDQAVPEHMYLRCFDDIYGFRGWGCGFLSSCVLPQRLGVLHAMGMCSTSQTRRERRQAWPAERERRAAVQISKNELEGCTSKHLSARERVRAEPRSRKRGCDLFPCRHPRPCQAP